MRTRSRYGLPLLGLWVAISGLAHGASPSAGPPVPDAAPMVPAAPVGTAAAPLGDLEVAGTFPAWDAVLVGRLVVVIDPDFLSLSAYDVGTGQRRWHTTVQKETGGRHTLLVRGAAVLFWAGDKLYRVNAETGAVLASNPVPNNGDCSFNEEGEICEFSCKCGAQLAACDTGQLVGTHYRKTYIEEFGHDGEAPHAGCFGQAVGLLAGAGSVAIVSVEDAKGKRSSRLSRERLVLGLDAATGRELWRSSALAQIGSGGDSGALGVRAWISSADGDLHVFHPRTGRPVFARPGLPNLNRVPRHLLQLSKAPQALFRLLESEATLWALSTGKVLWRTQLPEKAWAVLMGAPMPLYRIEAGEQPATVLILDPARGAVRGRVPLPAQTTVHDDPSGGFYVLGRQLVAYDADGRERGRLPKADPPNLFAGPDFAALFSGEQLAILDRRDLRLLGTLQGSYAVHSGSSLAGHILLYRYIDSGHKPGEAVLVRRKIP